MLRSGCSLLQRRGGKGGAELAKQERGERGGTKNPPRCPPRLPAPLRAGQSGVRPPAGRGAEGCGLPGLLLGGVGVSERRGEPMIYYTAVPASGASCSGAATAGQPAHTHTQSIPPHAARAPAALASPGTKCLQTTRWPGERAGRKGGDRGLGGLGKEGRYFPEKQPSPPSEPDARSRRDATAAAVTPPLPPGPGGPGHPHLQFLCNAPQVSLSEPG